jgi:hypothetical protein
MTPPPHDDQRAWDTLEPEFGAGNHVEVEHLSPSRRYNHQFGQIPLVMECFITVTPCLESICGTILYIASLNYET